MVCVITHAATSPLEWVVQRRVKGHVLPQQTGLSVAHQLCTSSHAFLLRQNFDHTGAVVWQQQACSHLRASMGAVKDHKANANLTAVYLESNKVGDPGAAALADALQATVLTCKKCVFRACVRCHRKCCFTESSEELASSTCCAVCVAAFVIFVWFEGESLFMSVSRELRAGCSQVDVAQCQNQTGLIEF